jgi:hypothetical protein
MESNENKDFELPEVVHEGVALETGQSHQESSEAVKLETAQATQQAPLNGAVSVQPVTVSLPAQDPSASQSATTIGSVVLTDLPAVADDIDLIEKEWVEKAKHIVQATLGDPYVQNKEINKIKADYIKKRYNKDIRTND